MLIGDCMENNSLVNEFGKKKTAINTSNSAAIVAGDVWVVSLTDAQLDSAPFNRLIMYNYSTEDVQVVINGHSSGTTAISGGGLTFWLAGMSMMVIEPEDNIRIYQIAIDNKDAANQIEIGELALTLQNH